MFLDHLEIEEEIDLKDKGFGVRQCKWLYVGSGIYLSIQASPIHYCIPRELVPLNEYTHFEMGIIKKYKLNYDISIFSEFPRYGELKSHFDGGVFAYVPRELLSDLYIWCLDNFKED